MTFPVAPLKTLGAVRVSNVDKHTVEGHAAVRLCNYVDVYKNETVVDDMAFMEATATQDQIKAFRLRPGDTVFTKDSETADDIGIPAYIASAGDDLICGYHLAIFRPRPDRIVPRFAFWAMKSGPVMARWETTATGVTRVGLKSSDIRKLPLPAPPLTEQRAIADYLDRETAKIDTLIRRQTTMIERLRERRIGVVAHATTRGIRPGVKLKDAPQWQGHVPAHWVEGPIRRALRFRRQLVGVAWSTTPLLSLTKRGVIVRDIESGEGKFPASFEGYQHVAPNDLIFCLFDIDETPRAVGRSLDHGMVTGAYTRYEVHKDVSEPRFLEWAFIAIDDGKRFRPLYTGLRKVIQKPRFAAARLALPPLDEQREIADYLDRETAKIDALITKVERHIELAKERRAALITAAVTGQIDVTTSTQSGDAA